MRPRNLILPLILLGAMALGGCATAEDRWYAQRDTLNRFELAVVDARNANLVTADDVVAMDAGVQAARAWLSAAKVYLPDGGDSFEAYLSAVNAAVVKLTPVLTEGAR